MYADRFPRQTLSTEFYAVCFLRHSWSISFPYVLLILKTEGQEGCRLGICTNWQIETSQGNIDWDSNRIAVWTQLTAEIQIITLFGCTTFRSDCSASADHGEKNVSPEEHHSQWNKFPSV